jgi:predicted membrane channel-forming protein YqfA (hemolysin III family)
VSALFGVSALYHRVTWTTPARRRMRRLDHSMIFLLIAGTYTPAGAAIYGLRRPDPVPAVFGYHEVFHLLVIAGVATHFLAISLFALPAG